MMNNRNYLQGAQFVVQMRGLVLPFVLLILIVLSSPLYSAIPNSTIPIPASILSKIHAEELYYSKQWQRLLHFKNGESEIDDPAFFLSKQGKKDLEGELKASIKKLLNDKSDDEKSMLCYYPSRSNWILEQLPELKALIKIPKCEALKKEMIALEAKRVTLILASAHINSPASAFGHTFLRIDASEETPLISYAVNYAAQTQETNGFIYAYQGLFGGYEGRYSIQPYSKKIKEYSDLEQRDIWEYPLDLTQAEVNRLVLHVFEIRHFYADYFFLSENCSYNLLWLIEIAKDNVELIKKFDHKAIPIDTLRAIADADLVKETVYRPSKRKIMLQKSQAIENIPEAIDFAKSSDFDLATLEGLSKVQKANALELGSHLLQVSYSKKKINKKEYLGHFLRLLNERSKLGDIPSTPIEAPFAPAAGHKSNKLTLSYGSDTEALMRMKVSYHDIYDNESGYVPGAYINFFDTALRYKDKQLKLHEINILDIRSYAIQDPIFKPVSWQISLGGKRIFSDELNAFLQVGAGVSLGNDKLFTYATVTPAVYYRDNSEHSVAANLGLIYNPTSSLKFGVLGSKEWFTKDREIITAEPFITYNITKDTALNLRHTYKELQGEKAEDTMLSLFYYY